MTIKIFKPGASEFKRKEHPIKIYRQVLNCFQEIADHQLTWKYLNDDRKAGGRILFDFYYKYKVLLKRSNMQIWDDRITSLFKREQLIVINQQGIVEPGPLGEILLMHDFKEPLWPFSNSDFILIIYCLLNDLEKNQGQSYLITALNILKSQEMPIDQFMFKFLAKDFERDWLEILHHLEKNNAKEIWKLFEPGSGSEENINKEQIIKDLKNLQNIIIQCFNLDLEKKNNFFIKYLINFTFNVPFKWNEYFNKALEFTFRKPIKQIISNFEKGIWKITNHFLAKFIYCFSLAKKFPDYTYLIKKYILSLPFFEVTKTTIRTNDQFKEIIERILKNAKELLTLKYSDHFKIYNLIVPLNLQKPIIDDKKFYPNLDEKFLETILQDNDLWVKKIINTKYQEKLNDLQINNLPTYYEFLTILYIYKKIIDHPSYYDFAKSINTLLNFEYLPTRFATGGHADGIIHLKGLIIIIEPTLVTGRRQMQFEIGIINHYKKHDANICLLISPSFPKESLAIIEKLKLASEKSPAINVLPITNQQLKYAIVNFKKQFKNFDNLIK